MVESASTTVRGGTRPEGYALTGLSALVTGGARGIGAAIARAFDDLGARVVVWDLDVASAPSPGPRLIHVAADVSDPVSVARAHRETQERIGVPDILVNNAGIQGPTVPIGEYDESAWDHVIATNLTSVFRLCRIYAGPMRAKGFGRIINIASVGGVRGLENGCAYGASKAGVIGFTMGLSKELIDSGVTVNCVAPALIDTELKAQMSEEFIARATARIPMKRLGRAEEVAATVAWIASPACSFTTGAVFDVAGGRLTI